MRLLAFSVTAALLVATPFAFAAQDSQSWDGLDKIHSSRVDAAYLLPGVDFRAYTKVMLDPTEVSFKRNWRRDYNAAAIGGGRITDAEAAQIADQVRTGFGDIFAGAYREAGYQVVTQAGPDVLRLRTGVINLYLDAPDQMSAGRTRTYSVEAGEATLVIEARDSLTGALLGRALDRQTAGDFPGLRTSVSNRADFGDLFRRWARISVNGLNALKERSAVSATTG